MIGAVKIENIYLCFHGTICAEESAFSRFKEQLRR